MRGYENVIQYLRSIKFGGIVIQDTLQCEKCGKQYNLKDCEEDIKSADFPFCPHCGSCPVGTKTTKCIPEIK